MSFGNEAKAETELADIFTISIEDSSSIKLFEGELGLIILFGLATESYFY